MDTAHLGAQHLPMDRPGPFPWSRGLFGAALEKSPLRPRDMRLLASLVSSQVAPKRSKLGKHHLDPKIAQFLALVDQCRDEGGLPTVPLLEETVFC